MSCNFLTDMIKRRGLTEIIDKKIVVGVNDFVFNMSPRFLSNVFY